MFSNNSLSAQHSTNTQMPWKNLLLSLCDAYRLPLKSLMVAGIFVAVLLLSSCGTDVAVGPTSPQPTSVSTQGNSNPPPAAPTQSTTNDNGTPSSEANVVFGTVVDTQGNPVPGADIEIVSSITDSSGEPVRYIRQTDANGTYSMQVPNGVYKVFANISVNYENVQWSLPLHPKDNSNQPMDSSNGIIKNFEWEIQGPQPGADGTQYSDYYGATLRLNLGVLNSVPAGSIFTFTLTPNGPLIDGSQGQPLMFTRTTQDLSTPPAPGLVSLDHTDLLYDIPIGDYTITGQMTAPDSSTQTVMFDGNSSEEISWSNKSEPSVHLVDLLGINITVG